MVFSKDRTNPMLLPSDSQARSQFEKHYNFPIHDYHAIISIFRLNGRL